MSNEHDDSIDAGVPLSAGPEQEGDDDSLDAGVPLSAGPEQEGDDDIDQARCATVYAGMGSGTTEPCPIFIMEIVQVLDSRTVGFPRYRRQYVNTGYADNHPEWGRRIRLKARAVCRSVCGDRPAPRGTQIYRANYDARPRGIVSGSPLPESLNGGFSRHGGPATRISVTSDNGWTEVVAFYLSAIGGDVFSVYATENDAEMRSRSMQGRRACRFHVWRKIWYEVDHMARPGSGRYGNSSVIDSAKRVFAATHIEMEETGRSSTPTTHRRLLNNTNVDAYLAGIRDRQGWSRYVHILFADSYSDQSRTHPRTFRLNNPNDPIRLSKADFMLDPNDWFIRAEFTQIGTTVAPITSIDPTNQQLILTEDDRYWEIFLNTNQTTGIGLSNNPVTVRLTFQHWIEPGAITILSTQTVLLPIRWMEREGARWDHEGAGFTATEFTTKCLTHELGHVMGLASDQLPNGTSLTGSGQTYSQQGPHCRGTIGDERCNMYHNVYENGFSFCDNCIAVLHGVNLSRLPVASGTNFAY